MKEEEARNEKERLRREEGNKGTWNEGSSERGKVREEENVEKREKEKKMEARTDERKEAWREREDGMKRKRRRNTIKLTYMCCFPLLHFRSN